jgi:CDP-glycerol glycerophosphotransferase
LRNPFGRRPRSRFDRVELRQDGSRLDVTVWLRRGVRATRLWAREGATAAAVPLVPFAATGKGAFRCVLDLAALPQQWDDAMLVVSVEVEQTVRADSQTARRLRADPVSEFTTRDDGQVDIRSRRLLGRARRTTVSGLHPVGNANPYLNKDGNLAIAFGRPLAGFGSVHVRWLALRKGAAKLRGRLNTRHGDVTSAELVLKARVGDRRLTYPVRLDFDRRRSSRRRGLRWYRLRGTFDLRRLLDEPGPVDDIYDAYLQVTTVQTPEGYEIRIGRTPLLVRYLTRPGWARQGKDALAISPYYTFKARRTSFRIARLPARDVGYLRRQIRLRHLLRLLHRRRDIWLVGERLNSAQDNGYWFFRHLREQHPEIEAHYVIAPDAAARERVEPLGNVVTYGTRDHIRLTLLASRIFSTHHPDYLFPVHTPEFGHAVRATRIFLQHGVMGTKWMASLYGKQLASFDADLFIVSSEREREYIVGDFGYDPAEVAVTGLARFDALFAGDVPREPRQLLIMPTWRDWLVNADTFLTSSYYLTWSAFLRDPRLHATIEEFGLDVIFCLHTNMAHYRDHFADLPVRVVSQADVDVQHLLKQSAMLVTDYSSVGFDFSFLDKPVAYFQFDRERFLGPPGSHLQLDDELPGPVLRRAVDVVDEIAARAAAGFQPTPEFVERAGRFIAHRDRHNSERILQAARSARRSTQLRERITKHPLLGVVPRALSLTNPPAVVRRHRLYLPLMRRLFALSARLPMRSDVVVFESSSGRSYSDSPRYIYEELVRARPDLTKVWAYRGRLPVADARTKPVARLSPAYFYYLGRAKYWVNNQSFPYYIRRRRNGVFVQTWHGTPLKRMLHDLPEIRGRDPGYLERASIAAQQWSLLVSPNSYTTEVMRTAYRYRGDTLEVGYPRNDVLHGPDRDRLTRRLRSALGLSGARQVVLYAPTFRDDQTTGGRFSFRLPFDLNRLRTELGEDTVLLLRMHGLVRQRIEIPPELQEVVRDVTRYPEMQELMLVSDVLVTDYSSVFVDYASLGRPMVFYAYDLETYRDDLRGFYLDFESLVPGPLVQTEDEFWAALRAAESLPGHAYREFVARFAPYDDGHASERVVAAVFGSVEG